MTLRLKVVVSVLFVVVRALVFVEPLMQVVVIIVVSVVYFIVVLLSEVYMMLSAGRKQKAKGKGDKVKRDAAKQRGFIDMADATMTADAGRCTHSMFMVLFVQIEESLAVTIWGSGPGLLLAHLHPTSPFHLSLVVQRPCLCSLRSSGSVDICFSSRL